jgi:hypothetical protein
VNTAIPETRSPDTSGPPGTDRPAALDEMHVGDINGAFGTVREHDTMPRRSLRQRLLTMMAIMGPGLIVMIGDNDAGGVATYTQAGQNYGTHLLWTLPLLAPVLYLNQEMVLRLGAVSGVGHGRLILERFGRFWATFSVGDLFILNFLTIITQVERDDQGEHRPLPRPELAGAHDRDHEPGRERDADVLADAEEPEREVDPDELD